MAVPKSPYDYVSDMMPDMSASYAIKRPESRTHYMGIPYPESHNACMRLLDELDRQLYHAQRGNSYGTQAYGPAPTNVSVKCVLEKEKEPVKVLPHCPPAAKEKKLLLV